MVTHNTTAQLSYDPETGAWDGQLPHADLVDQLSPPIKEHSLPELDNTVKTLFYWAMDLDIPHGPRLALLTILRHIDWKEGDHCIAGIQTLARESQFSKKTLKGHLKYLVDAKLISRFRHIGRTTETRLGTVGVETTPMVGVEPTPETNSSSTNPFNQLAPGLVDAKRVDDSEPEPDGVTAGGLNSFSLEEERTGDVLGQQPTPEPSKPTEPAVSAPPSPSDLEEARAFVDAVLPEIPTDSGIESLGKHCWSEWEKHWGGVGLLPGIAGPKTRRAERSFGKTLWPSLQRWGCPSRRNPTSTTRPRGNVRRLG